MKLWMYRYTVAMYIAAVWINAWSAQAQPCEITRLIASDGAPDDRFGWSTGISGDYAVVGAYQATESGFLVDVPAAGVAYIFERDGLSWNEIGHISPSSGTPPVELSLLGSDDDYGYAVAIDGRNVVVGARLHDTDGMVDRGAAYVFRRSGAGQWQYVTELVAPDGRADDWFGHSVAISGDWIVIGAPQDDDAGTADGGNSGSAYVFHFDGTNWLHAVKLTASDDAIGDYFGDSVDVDSDWIAVGASRDDDACGLPVDPGCNSGSVYVFYHDSADAPDSWLEAAKLTARHTDGSPDDQMQDLFGSSLSLRDDRVVVGAWSNDYAGLNSGTAYVYHWDGVDWLIEQKLVASDAAAGDSFGRLGVAVEGDRILIGAHKGDVDSPFLADAGTAYVFRRSGATWTELAELSAGDATAGARFGQSASISGDYAIVGAYSANGNGPAYIFVIGSGKDCNENGAHDDCELLADPTADANGNGTLDECECTDDQDCSAQLACATGICNQVTHLCEFVVNAGFCVVGDLCFQDGTFNPDNDCESCDSAAQRRGWSPRGIGTACSDPANTVCDRPDTCDGAGVCQSNPEPAGTACPDDGNECTLDECDGNGTCAHPAVQNDTPCQDDGNECTENLCRSGACTAVARSAGWPCGDPINTHCNPADSCDGNGTCLDNVLPAGSPCASDGIFCTGIEVCQSGICVSSGNPCSNPGLVCDALAEERQACSCDPAVTGACDDGVFCNGEEVCQDGVCVSGSNPCIASGLLCDEVTADCVACLSESDCADDGNECTETVCDDGVCVHPPVTDGTPCGSISDSECTHPDMCRSGICDPNHEPPGTPCGSAVNTDCDRADTCSGQGWCNHNIQPDGTPCTDDGLFCTGNETCRYGTCVSGRNPCVLPTPVCDEVADKCRCGSDADCDNGVFCDGAEICDPDGVCVNGPNPCGSFQVCIESIDFCACDGDDDCPEDGLFCNGEEVCISGVCASAGNPCMSPTPVCDEMGRVCLCSSDADCNDGNACNGIEVCTANGECVHQFTFDCDGDGQFDDCGTDCNANDVPDECDVRDGTSVDCQGNGIPDECEAVDIFRVASGDLSPLYASHPQSFSVVAPPPATETVTFRFQGTGDFFSAHEFVDVELNGVSVGSVFRAGAADCGSVPTQGSLTMDAVQFNAVVGGADAVITMTPSTTVDPEICPRSSIAVELEYAVAGTPRDCNHNGVPDECDLADGVSQDCQANGVPDECDIVGEFYDKSGLLFPFDALAAQSYTIVAPPLAVGEVTLLFIASADLFGDSEYVDVSLNGTAVGRVFEFGGYDCTLLPIVESVLVPASAFNAVAAEGDIVVNMTASAEVNGTCPVSYIGVSVWYESVRNDCNGNATPDVCDMAAGDSFDCQFNGIPDECETDCNANGLADECDLADGTSADCQGNGIPDECEPDCNGNNVADDCDLRDSTSADCQSNGIPDECDVDCNANNVPDDCDIRDAVSIDCQSNGIPDECEPDCNGNGIADDCDVYEGTSVDCNGNAVPDDCDIDSGTSPDCQGNGVPDECEVSNHFDDSSGPLGPITANSPLRHIVASPPKAKGPVTLFFTASGDLSSSAEYIEVDIEGIPLGRIFEVGGTDCADPPNTDTFTVPASLFNATAAAGEVGFGMTPNAAVDDYCEGTYITVTVTYQSAEVDCNDNGVPDECDIASGTSADCQSNFVPDECEVDTIFEAVSGLLSPVEDDTSNQFTVYQPPPPNGDVTLSFLVSAALRDTSDYIRVYVEDAPIGAVFEHRWIACPGYRLAAEETLILSESAFQEQANDGSVTISMVPQVYDYGQPPCADSFIATTLSYEQQGIDCNHNLVPDECELETFDCDGNGRPDDCDLPRCVETSPFCQDCNGNGIQDGCDIAADRSLDCPGGFPNGIPDQCEPDCQPVGVPGHGVADSCDIASGTSAACNDNGIPDECEADCNENGVEDSCDIANGTEPDCNANLIPDSCDIASATSTDCQSNGIPDECEPDCNENGIADVCDIASGGSLDCNKNGNPDECDVTAGPDCNGNEIPDICEVDCNANTIPDDCDLADGTSLDCNVNQIPDECDLSEQTSHDCNGNQVPDECDIASGASPDCQPNDIPDDCEILEGKDCNGTGIPDDCDIAGGVSLDCQPNGTPDECEVGLPFLDTSSALTPFDRDHPQSHTILQAPPAAQDVSLTFTASADLSRISEYVDVFLNDTPLGRVFEQGASDCADPGDIETLTVPAATYNAALAVGDTVLRMAPSTGVDPGICSSSYISVTLSYAQQGLGGDCNGNLIPDDCDGLGADFDRSGAVDLKDYGYLQDCLGGPQTAPQPVDAACAPACLEGFDADQDGDVDLRDAGNFMRGFSAL